MLLLLLMRRAVGRCRRVGAAAGLLGPVPALGGGCSGGGGRLLVLMLVLVLVLRLPGGDGLLLHANRGDGGIEGRMAPFRCRCVR